MLIDIYAGHHSTTNRAAVSAHERAVRCFAAHRPFMAHSDEALRAEPKLPAAIAMQGLAQAMIGRAHGTTASAALVPAVQAALEAVDGGTTHERALAAAHTTAANGHVRQAAAVLEAHLATNPTDLLALKLAHALRFMSGDADRMHATSAAALPNWSEAMPGYGFVLGCRAFALEESGQLREAEDFGRRAVTHEPDDVWALHAVAHAMEMGGRTSEGRAWLEPARNGWASCGGFGQHLVWHLALFHLAEGDHGRALALYDEGVTPDPNGDFRDMANAVSLLWRLEQEGVDPGARWQKLYEIAHARRLDCSYAFGSLHYLLALIAAGDRTAADELVSAMRRRARSQDGDQAAVLSRVAVPLAEAILGGSHTAMARDRLSGLARSLPSIGGSHAQRDVFLRTLLVQAAQSGDVQALGAVSAVRGQQRQEDRFQSLVQRRFALSRRTVVTNARINTAGAML